MSLRSLRPLLFALALAGSSFVLEYEGQPELHVPILVPNEVREAEEGAPLFVVQRLDDPAGILACYRYSPATQQAEATRIDLETGETQRVTVTKPFDETQYRVVGAPASLPAGPPASQPARSNAPAGCRRTGRLEAGAP